LKAKPIHITVFEHESLRTDRGTPCITNEQLEALSLFYGENGVPYYSLINKGVKFNKYVGVIQTGKTVIEVLPKADKGNDMEMWRKILISMLHAAGILDIHAPSSSNLNLKANSILDLYFEFFIQEIEYLLHRGLIKKYRKTEGNKTSLKGSIQFAKHISQNLVHQERFYVRYSTYDKEHDIHAILYKTLKLLNRINTNISLNSRLGSVLLDFPELYDIKISESVFDKIVLNRKIKPYKNALEIARMLLLNYHPDLSHGINNILALMFDMNLLWERFVYVSLHKYKSGNTTIAAQNTMSFWKPDSGNRSSIRPDIVLNRNTDTCVVLDTKWKNLNGSNPSPEDLRQMFVYMEYFGAKKVALVYPGAEYSNKSGHYYDHGQTRPGELSDEECSIISIGVEPDIRKWQKEIHEKISDWVEET